MEKNPHKKQHRYQSAGQTLRHPAVTGGVNLPESGSFVVPTLIPGCAPLIQLPIS